MPLHSAALPWCECHGVLEFLSLPGPELPGVTVRGTETQQWFVFSNASRADAHVFTAQLPCV